VIWPIGSSFKKGENKSMFVFKFGKKQEKKIVGPGAKRVKLTALISYLGFFCLIPLFSENKLTRFHAKQGLAILLAEFIFTAAVLTTAFFVEYGSVWHSILIWSTILFWSLTTVLRVIGISYAARDMDREVPLAGYLAGKLFRF